MTHKTNVTYLDYNATTPLDPRVFDRMKPYFLEEFGNPASRTHTFGATAKEAVDRSRQQIANVSGCRSEEVIFTSGATESNNIALLGILPYGENNSRRHILTTGIEHKSVIEPARFLSKRGFEIEYLPIDRSGVINPEDVKRRIKKETLLVSVMHANNETGTIQPIKQIADILNDSDTLFHVDASQTFGKLHDLCEVRYDLMSCTAHKICGPKGVGALVMRRNKNAFKKITPILFGGTQEMSFRPGTIPVPLVVGFGFASEIAQKENSERNMHSAMLKKKLLAGLGKIRHSINGDPSRCLPHTLNITIDGVDSEALMLALKGKVAISNGSACTSSLYAPSHVLKAMGLSDSEISSSIRISWGPGIEVLPIKEIVSAVEHFLS